MTPAPAASSGPASWDGSLSYGRVDPGYAARLRRASSESDGAIYMLTLTSFRPGSGQQPGGYTADPDSRYAPVQLFSLVGARLCFMADVVASPGGWHRIGVVRYPSRRAFIELTDSAEASAWNDMKERRATRMILVCVLPSAAVLAAGMPAAQSQRVLAELWHGPAPEPIAGGVITEFEVEGTFIGDGRDWTGARFTVLRPQTVLPLQPTRLDYEAMLVDPVIERWSLPRLAS